MPRIGSSLLGISIDSTQEATQIRANRELAADVYVSWALAADCPVIAWITTRGFPHVLTWDETACSPPPPIFETCAFPNAQASAWDPEPDWSGYQSCNDANWNRLQTFQSALDQRRAGNALWMRQADIEPDPGAPAVYDSIFKLAELARAEAPHLRREMLLIGALRDESASSPVDLSGFNVVVVLNLDDPNQYRGTKLRLEQWLRASGARATVDAMGTPAAVIAEQLRAAIPAKQGGTLDK